MKSRRQDKQTAACGGFIAKPEPQPELGYLVLVLCSVSMTCAEAERRTTCVLWTTAERSCEGSCQRKAGNPLRAAKKTEANYVCLMRKGSKLSSPSSSLSLFVVWGVKLICRCTHSAVASICICACACACLMWREFNILTSGAGYQICLLLLHITHKRMGKVIADDCISGTTWRIINISPVFLSPSPFSKLIEKRA